MSHESHEIFITRTKKGAIGAEDEEITMNVADIIKSISYPIGAINTIKSHGWCKDIYAMLAIYPGWSEEERAQYLGQYREQIIDAFTSLDLNYIAGLHVKVGYNGSSKNYVPQDFVTIKNDVAKRLGITIDQTS